MTPREYAHALGVSRHTVYTWLRTGQLTGQQQPNRRWAIGGAIVRPQRKNAAAPKVSVRLGTQNLTALGVTDLAAFWERAAATPRWRSQRAVSDILSARWYPDGRVRQTLAEMGQAWGVTRERARQLLAWAWTQARYGGEP